MKNRISYSAIKDFKQIAKMKRIITTLGLFVLTSVVAGCSWTDRQIGPNDYEISGYFDFTMKGEVVAKGLEDQACLYCKGIQENLVPQVYYITDKNRIFNYEAQRAPVQLFAFTVFRTTEVKRDT